MDNKRGKKTVNRMVWYCFHCGNWESTRAWGPPEWYYDYAEPEDWPVCYRCLDDIYPLTYLSLERERGQHTPDARPIRRVTIW